MIKVTYMSNACISMYFLGHGTTSILVIGGFAPNVEPSILIGKLLLIIYRKTNTQSNEHNS